MRRTRSRRARNCAQACAPRRAAFSSAPLSCPDPNLYPSSILSPVVTQMYLYLYLLCLSVGGVRRV